MKARPFSCCRSRRICTFTAMKWRRWSPKLNWLQDCSAFPSLLCSVAIHYVFPMMPMRPGFCRKREYIRNHLYHIPQTVMKLSDESRFTRCPPIQGGPLHLSGRFLSTTCAEAAPEALAALCLGVVPQLNFDLSWFSNYAEQGARCSLYLYLSR